MLLAFLLSACAATASAALFGLELEHNAPTEVGLIAVDTDTGNITRLGCVV